MERFKTEHSTGWNPQRAKILSVFLAANYTILAVIQLIDRDYFFVGVYILGAILMLNAYLNSTSK